jgi:hypothetical protein
VDIRELKEKATSTKEEEAAKVEQLKELKEKEKLLDIKTAELLSIIKKDEALGLLFPLPIHHTFHELLNVSHSATNHCFVGSSRRTSKLKSDLALALASLREPASSSPHISTMSGMYDESKYFEDSCRNLLIKAIYNEGAGYSISNRFRRADATIPFNDKATLACIGTGTSEELNPDFVASVSMPPPSTDVLDRRLTFAKCLADVRSCIHPEFVGSSTFVLLDLRHHRPILPRRSQLFLSSA